MGRITSPRIKDGLFTKRTAVFEIFVRGDFFYLSKEQKKAVKLRSASFTAQEKEVTYKTVGRGGVVVKDHYVKLRLKRDKHKSKNGTKSEKNAFAPGDPVSGRFTVTLYLGPEQALETCFLEAIEYIS